MTQQVYKKEQFYADVAQRLYSSDILPLTVETTYLRTKDILNWGFKSQASNSYDIDNMIKDGCKAYKTARAIINKEEAKIASSTRIINNIMDVISTIDDSIIETCVSKSGSGIIAEMTMNGRIYNFLGRTNTEAINGLKRKYAIENHAGDWVGSQYLDELSEIIKNKQK